jgi:hypothetical protein
MFYHHMTPGSTMGQVHFNYKTYILSSILNEREPNKPPPCGERLICCFNLFYKWFKILTRCNRRPFLKTNVLGIVSHHISNVLHYDISKQQKKVATKQIEGHAQLETKVLPLKKKNLFTKFCKFLSLDLHVYLNQVPFDHGLFPIFPLTKVRSMHEY